MSNRFIVLEGDVLAVFNSLHRVMSAEKLLKSLKLPDLLLIPAPRSIQTDCGLALRFAEDDLGTVLTVLQKEKLLPAFVSQYRGEGFITVWRAEEQENESSARL